MNKNIFKQDLSLDIMKFTKGFWIALVIIVVLFILPTILTYGAPAYDGSMIFGFPLPYYSFGGLCLSSDGGGKMCSSFSTLNLVIDLIILVGLPLLVNYLILRNKK